jgi:hypothetical protein
VQAGGRITPAEGAQPRLPAGLEPGELVDDGGVQRAPDRGQRADPEQARLLRGGVGDGRDTRVPVLQQAARDRVQRGPRRR